MRAGDTVFLVARRRRKYRWRWIVEPVMFHCLHPRDAERVWVQTHEPGLVMVLLSNVFEHKDAAMAALRRAKALDALERTA